MKFEFKDKIINFNVTQVSLVAKYYELIITLVQLSKINKVFSNFENTNDLINWIINSLKQKSASLKFSDDKCIIQMTNPITNKTFELNLNLKQKDLNSRVSFLESIIIEQDKKIYSLEERIIKLETLINEYMGSNKEKEKNILNSINDNKINPNMTQINQPEMKDYPQKESIKQENEVQFNYELIIFLKEDKIFAYNEKNGLFSLQLNENLKLVPEKSRFVNLGQSVLLTGGKTKENKVSKKCYLIALFENNSSKESLYTFNISIYQDLQEGRERHNLIFLPDKNYVFACGGFFSKSCEYTNLYKGNWELIASMNKKRGNASMAYINNSIIYIIGGFELENSLSPGNYLDDIEYFDINNFKNGWKTIKFLNSNKYNLGLTALGIVPISKSIFLICGGYDGKNYKKNAYKVDCKNYQNPLVEQIQEINNPTIFTHNMFCKIKNNYFNFDYGGQIFCFDYDNWRFKKLNINQEIK